MSGKQVWFTRHSSPHSSAVYGAWGCSLGAVFKGVRLPESQQTYTLIYLSGTNQGVIDFYIWCFSNSQQRREGEVASEEEHSGRQLLFWSIIYLKKLTFTVRAGWESVSLSLVISGRQAEVEREGGGLLLATKEPIRGTGPLLTTWKWQHSSSKVHSSTQTTALTPVTAPGAEEPWRSYEVTP